MWRFRPTQPQRVARALLSVGCSRKCDIFTGRSARATELEQNLVILFLSCQRVQSGSVCGLDACLIVLPCARRSRSFPACSQKFRVPRKRKKRPNWPYRFTWLAILGSVVAYLAIQTVVGAMTFGNRSYGIDWGLAFVGSCLDATVAVWFVVVGASLGSFLNVVAYRLPLGRYIGGHSSCPFCCTPIDSTDNVPVLGWVKLRGRCRCCRLPISVQYPLVELSVAILFLLVYVFEFSTSGSNLPGARRELASSLMRVAVTPLFVARIVTFLLALVGFIAAALIAVRRKAVPFKLYIWSLIPTLLAALVQPDLLVVRWREAAVSGFIEERLDVLATCMFGAAAGIAIARLLAPLLFPRFDRSLMSSGEPTREARQFLGAMGLAGALFGWQAMVAFSWVLLTSAILAVLLMRRFRDVAHLGDLTVWMWLGVLLFRSWWKELDTLQVLPSSLPEVARYVLGAILLAPLALVFRICTPSPSGSGGEQPEAEFRTASDESPMENREADVAEDAVSEDGGVDPTSQPTKD